LAEKFVVGTIWYDGTKPSNLLHTPLSSTDITDILKVYGS